MTWWVPVAAAGLWLAVYRLPLRTPRARQRFRLFVASATGLPGKYVFPLVGTGIYLAGGLLAALVVAALTGVDLIAPLRWHVTAHGIAATALAIVGANALTAFAMSIVYAVRPRIDVPGAITSIRWIQEITVLGPRWRWIIPMLSAAVEEYYFRGVFLLGLVAAGAPAWAALLAAGLTFTAMQAILTENRVQALVLVLASATLSVVGGLLAVTEHSVLPAILVHASFAGYYTHASFTRPRQ